MGLMLFQYDTSMEWMVEELVALSIHGGALDNIAIHSSGFVSACQDGVFSPMVIFGVGAASAVKGR